MGRKKFKNVIGNIAIGNNISQSIVITGNSNVIFNGNNINEDCIEGKGEIIKKEFDFAGFTDIVINSIPFVNINITDEKEGVSIETHENIMPLIEVLQKRKILKISLKGCVINPKINININVKNLEGITLTGGASANINSFKEVDLKDFYIEQAGGSDCQINLKGKIKEFEIDLSGTSSCYIDGKLDIKDLEIDLSGASDLKFKAEGNIKEATIDLSGSSDIEILNPVIENVEVDMSGTSTTYINAKYIEGDISGASRLIYKKSTIIDIDVDSFGVSNIVGV